jgi:hypothetical protein
MIKQYKDFTEISFKRLRIVVFYNCQLAFAIDEKNEIMNVGIIDYSNMGFF